MLREGLLTLAFGAMVPAAWGQPYVDVAASSGLSEVARASGAAVADIDLDGDLDLYVVSPEEHDPDDPSTWNRLFRNRGDGTFEDITAGSGIEPFDGGYRRGQQGNRFGASWGDYDGDRLPDLYLTRVGPERLYRNLGDGTFEDVTVQTGVYGTDDTANDVSAVWSDLDGDGDLDLYVSAWIGPNRLYRNDGGNQFTEVAGILGVRDMGFTWTTLPLDVNQDGRLDLYVVNDFGPNRLYVQLEDGRFADETETYSLGDAGNGMGVALADLNEDGRPDLYVTNIADRMPNPLYLGAAGPFLEVAQSVGVHDTGWGWGVEFFDADHDGDQDLYVVNGFPTHPGPNRFFVRADPGSDEMAYRDATAESGAGGLPEARGLVVFDREGDGDLDLLVANFRAPSALFERRTTTGNWIGFWLSDNGGNRWGVGARVRVLAAGRWMTRYQDGVDLLGQSLVPAHFGLGATETVDRVEVRWPDGTVQTWEHLQAGRYHTLHRDSSASLAVQPAAATAVAWTPYPNPAKGHVTLQPFLQIRIFDTLGRLVGTRQSDARGTIDVSDLPRGLLLFHTPGGLVGHFIHR